MIRQRRGLLRKRVIKTAAAPAKPASAPAPPMLAEPPATTVINNYYYNNDDDCNWTPPPGSYCGLPPNPYWYWNDPNFDRNLFFYANAGICLPPPPPPPLFCRW